MKQKLFLIAESIAVAIMVAHGMNAHAVGENGGGIRQYYDPFGAPECNDPDFVNSPLVVPLSYHQMGLSPNHPCYDACSGSAVTALMCDTDSWYRSFCGNAEVGRMNAYSSWNLGGRIGPKPSSYCAEYQNSMPLGQTGAMLPDGDTSCPDPSAVWPGCIVKTVQPSTVGANALGLTNSYEGAMAPDVIQLYGGGAPHDTWWYGDPPIDSCTQYAWYRFYEFSQFQDAIYSNGVDHDARALFNLAFQGGIASKMSDRGYLVQRDNKTPIPDQISLQKYALKNDFFSAPISWLASGSAYEIPISDPQIYGLIRPLVGVNFHYDIEWHREMGRDTTHDYQRYVYEDLKDRYTSIIAKRAWIINQAMDRIRTINETNPAAVLELARYSLSVAGNMIGSKLSCSSTPSTDFTVTPTTTCKSEYNEVVSGGAMVQKIVDSPLLLGASNQEFFSAIAAELAKNNKMATDVLATAFQAGCLDPQSSLCDWSPRMFIKELLTQAEHVKKTRDVEYQECVDRLQIYATAPGGKFPVPLSIYYDNGIKTKDGAICNTTSTPWQTTAAVRKVIDCEAAKGAMAAAKLNGDSRAQKVGSSSYGLKQRSSDSGRWGSGDWSASFSYDIGWELPDLKLADCSWKATADGKASVDAAAYGKPFNFLTVSANAGIGPKPQTAYLWGTATASVKVAGMSVWTRTATTDQVNKTGISWDLLKLHGDQKWDTDVAAVPFSILGVPLTLSAGIGGHVGYDLGIDLGVGSTYYLATCGNISLKERFAFAPYGAVHGELAVGIGFPGLSAGVYGDISLIKISLPVTQEAALQLYPERQVSVSAAANMTLSTLNGEAGVYGELLWWKARKKILSWKGPSHSYPIWTTPTETTFRLSQL